MLNEDGRIEGEMHPEEEDRPIREQVCSFVFSCMNNFFNLVKKLDIFISCLHHNL